MRSHRLSSALAALFAFGAVAACSGSPSEPEPGPPPTDPVVYDASAATTSDLGIAKWGYAVDGADGATVYRAYGKQNQLLVEIRQTFTQTDDVTKTFAMKMTGPAAQGSERIDFVAEWAADGESMDYVTNVRDNTFAEGSVAARILARLAPDAMAMPVLPGEATGSVTKSVKPLDQSPGLVTPGSEPLLVCCQQLTRESAQMSAVPGSECPLVTPTNQSLVTGAAPRAWELDLEGQGGIGPRALVLGPDGKPSIQSPWAGPYNIVDHHCHNAAAQNSSKTDGYIGCVPESARTATAGHTINWAPDPSRAGAAGAFCAYEPQANGGTLLNNRVCCWQGSAGRDGAPLFSNAGAQGCVTQLCLGQATFPGWFSNWFSTPPRAYPAGSTPPVPNDCPASTTTAATCNTCCTGQANNVSSLFGSAGAQYVQQIQSYRTRCAVACTDADLLRQAQAAQARRCAQSALQAQLSRAQARSSCASPR